MSKLSKSVFDKIKKEHIKPRPRWEFILLHSLLWIAFTVSIFIGSIAIGIMLRHFVMTEWDLLPRAAGGHVRGFFLVLPYIWLAVLGVIMYLAYKLFKQTKTGYKRTPFLIVGVSIFISIFLGTILYGVRTADFLEEKMHRHFPPYARWREFREHIWVAPEQGVLAGTIIEIQKDQIIILNDLKEKLWIVDIEKTVIPPRLIPEVGINVICIGEQTDEDTFRADTMKPWRGRRGF